MIKHPAHLMPFCTLAAGLKAAVDSGAVATKQHGELTMYAYTNRCTYERMWNEFSLISRGLILHHAAQRIVATTFPKFFNYGEGSYEVPDLPFTVSEKMDGSLGIIYWHNDEWHVATRGSFDSEQSRWAKAQFWTLCYPDELQQGCTYLVEIIYPENRIVVSYPKPTLVLLSAYDPYGVEFDRELLSQAAFESGMELVDSIECSGLPALLAIAKEMACDREGFVVRFSNGLRLKIKGDEYCRIHRLMSECTPLGIWEAFMAGDNIGNIRMELPEELRRDFDAICNKLELQFQSLQHDVLGAVNRCAEMDDKALGLLIQSGASGFSEPVRKFIFQARKGNWFTAISQPGVPRQKAFQSFRPNGNRLDGYEPSTVLLRFEQESNT